MTANTPLHADPLLSCQICLTEIPASVGSSIEGREYVHYFFGPECFAVWEQGHNGETGDSINR